MGCLDLEVITGNGERGKEGKNTEKAGNLKNGQDDTKPLEARDFKQVNVERNAETSKTDNISDNGKSGV